MGIRNLGRLRRGAPGAVLITPHGDSEPAEDGDTMVLAEAHNPSWGFGTSGRALADYLGSAS